MAYNAYGQNWMNQSGYPYFQNQVQPQQSFSPPMPQTNLIPQKPIFVDGEMAARVFQMPDNWPIGVPLYLWDSNGDYFYIKMVGQNGIPMPLQIFQYQKVEREQTSGYISGAVAQPVDTSQFITKDDFNRQMNELRNMLHTNQNGQQNRGGNK